MPSETPNDPNALTLIRVLRATLKGLLLFMLFNLVYRLCEPVQTASMPTLYNSVVKGQTRLGWGQQSDLPLLLHDHEIWTASVETWNVAILGSSETYGWSFDDTLSTTSILNDWRLETQGGQPLRFYNLAVPSGDVWKDLMIAEQVLQAGLPIDLLVFNFYDYAFQAEYPHPLMIHNPTIARTIIEKYEIDSSWLAYLPDDRLQTFWSERSVLAYWIINQVEALNWQIIGNTPSKPEVVPLTGSLKANLSLPITRADFVQAFHKLADEYRVDVLVINVPRPYDEDPFSAWIREQALNHHVSLLDCEFTFKPGAFYDFVHMMPATYPEYARLLIKHLTSSEMGSVSSQLPLRIPADFVPPDETCVFQPAS